VADIPFQIDRAYSALVGIIAESSDMLAGGGEVAERKSRRWNKLQVTKRALRQG